MSLLKFIVSTFLALTATTGGVAYAANASSPGDLLHGLDLAMENIQLNLAPDVASKVQLRLEFASERLAEAHTTFSENDVADGLEAVNEYGEQISAIAQLVGGPGGADQEALASLLETAHGVHTEVLTALLDKVPEQARDSIQKAIDASSSPAGIPGSTPGATSVSDDVGESNDAGASNAAGTPEAVGTPNDAGRPEGVGTPNGANAPGADISACATSLSQENAQALADLAKQHGVDYQYVLENFCTLRTLERVEEMLSGLQGPPTNVPAGPPTDIPNGPPSNTPGGPPITHPGRP